MNNVKITMLGYTGAGKTTYMVGMYAIMRRAIKGFSFTTHPDVDLDLVNAWKQMRLRPDTSQKRFPKPSDRTTKYTFDFRYGLKKLVSFDWIDYRGGALADRQEIADVQELHSHIRGSDCVLLCVSGEHLQQPLEDDLDIADNMASARMLHFFEAFDRASQKPTVVIVITKSDYIETAGRTKDEVLEDIQELFSPFFAYGQEWLVMICQVSLGSELSKDPELGAIAPYNVHLPVTFSIYSAFKAAEAAARTKVTSQREKLGELQSKWWSRTFDKDSIASGQAELEELDRLAEQHRATVKLLGEQLVKGARFFFNGVEVELDT